MKVKIKTKEQLFEDGWALNRDGVYANGDCVHLVEAMDEYFGKEIEIDEGSHCEAGWFWPEESYEQL